MGLNTTESFVLTDEMGKQYHLYDNFASGGEGSIYRLRENNSEVAKLYNTKSLASENDRTTKENKIRIMINHPVSNVMSNGQMLIAWPNHLLYNGSKFCGFIMPKIDSKYMIFDVYRQDARLKQFPRFTWRTLLAYSYNLSIAVNRVHAAGHAIGDMNPKNIVINPHGGVCLIDSDSFNIVDPSSGSEFRCCVGIGECLAPELQGRNLKIGTNQFSSYSDNFSLAMTIFKLLMNGNHPFNCKVLKTKQSSVGYSKLENGIAQGTCPYIKSIPGMSIPPTAPNFQMIPKELRELFIRAFSYDDSHINKTNRPTADEWVVALYNVLTKNEFSRCTKNKKHVWHSSYHRCPWCEIGMP